MADKSIFTKIIEGEIPAHKIYEDELTLAFLNIYPRTPGHILVVSKKQVDHLWDLPDEDYQAVMATCKKVANRLREVLRPKRVGVHVVGLHVPHVHVHIFPFSNMDEFSRHIEESGEPDHAALAEMAKKLAF